MKKILILIEILVSYYLKDSPHDSASVHACAFFILVTGTSVDACAIVGDC